MAATIPLGSHRLSWSNAMKYIAHRRFRGKAICGELNLPAMTEVECENGVIFCGKRIICSDHSENAHQFFARNDDGHGMERGRLTQAIMKTLAKRSGRDDEAYQERWDRVWADPVCQPYKSDKHADYWLWNHEFFNAGIDVLRHIAELVGAKVKE